jgi:hypothetical protein
VLAVHGTHRLLQDGGGATGPILKKGSWMLVTVVA